MKIKPELLLLLSPLLLNSSCSHSKGEVVATDTEMVYEASTVKSKSLAKKLMLPGELEGYYETGIMAKINGYVKQVLVDIGDHVSQGQLLVILEAPELMSQLSEALSEVKSKEAQYLNTRGRYVRLIQTNKTQGAVSPYDMDLGKTNIMADSLAFMSAMAKYDAVKQLTNYLTITAPFDGIITDRSVAPGAFVGPHEIDKPIYKLKNETQLRLHVALPEKYIAEIKKDDAIKFYVKSFPDRMFKGKVTRLARSLTTKTRSELIEILIDNHTGQLLPGMYANAILELQRSEPTLVVPNDAVITTMERSFVIKVNENGEAFWVDVQKGEQEGEQQEIFGNILAGDTVLNSASDEIKDHTHLKIIMTSKD